MGLLRYKGIPALAGPLGMWTGPYSSSVCRTQQQGIESKPLGNISIFYLRHFGGREWEATLHTVSKRHMKLTSFSHVGRRALSTGRTCRRGSTAPESLFVLIRELASL